MTPEERELLSTLRRQHADLRQSLALLDQRLEQIEARAQAAVEPPPPPVLPPLPPVPSFPRSAVEFRLPPIPVSTEPPPPPIGLDLPPIPPAALPPLPPAPRPPVEFHFARWLTRLGALCGLITLALVLGLAHAWLAERLGPAGLLVFGALVCGAFVLGGWRLDRPGGRLRFFGRFLALAGLVALYFIIYAAHYSSLDAIASPLVEGLLLLAWSALALLLADRRNSASLAFFAILLAYFGTAVDPALRFALAANLLLAGAAVLLLWRRGWSLPAWVALAATYAALLHHLVVDENGDFSLETTDTLHFVPCAVYLLGAWAVFSAAAFFTTAPAFTRANRLALLTANNLALAFLLALATYIAGYGFRDLGWSLFGAGLLLLLTAVPARLVAGIDAAEACFAQGLAVLTLGLIGVFGSITRGLLLLGETLLLGAAALFFRGPVLRFAAGIAAFLAAVFLLWNIGVYSYVPWRLGLLGCAVLLVAASWLRRSLPGDRPVVVPAAAWLSALGLLLLAVTMATKLGDSALPPALACAAVLFTAALYFVPMPELALTAQALLLGAQALVLFPAETGEEMPQSSIVLVALLTFGLLVWWSRQRVLPRHAGLVALSLTYALALVGLAWHAVRPFVADETWMVSAAALSFLFLAVGALSRVWTLAAMGLLFLLASLEYFFFPNGLAPGPYPWTPLAAAVPIAVVYATGRVVRSLLRVAPETLPSASPRLWPVAAGAADALVLVMISRAIFGLLPSLDWIVLFLFLGSFILVWHERRGSSLGVRASYLPSFIGVVLVLWAFDDDPRGLSILPNALALFALLLQPDFLRLAAARPGGRRLVSEVEIAFLTFYGAVTGWFFVDAWVATRLHPNHLAVAWTLYALLLFLLGLLAHERWQRWCGLFILGAAVVRVLGCDIWGFSTGYQVGTFVVLTLLLLAVGFLCSRFADRLRHRP